ncbi:hypothetical protein FC27_GL002125 [Companilactobacillus versmoldensis DSM 14857 = KCTC 3814]|uniref:DUF3923 family protein n=1 Tax=Companilactobacillus versmoldensis DSM 14857 = KCTC 3814 TaxID=1423815 RepID=A0A0R1SLN0_9LACO|nr:hypothetical protein FC27_GL002125 [Companilactobacillus versmoldensis DSM 14857 = KCTC 3814]
MNIFWIVLILGNAVNIMLRKYDGAGIYQTNQLKFATLAILGVFLIFIGLFQWLALYFIKRSDKKQGKNDQ